MNEQETRMLAVTGLSFEKGPDLFADARAIIDSSKKLAYRSVNAALVFRNWLIGCRIAEEDIGGASRAEYGKQDEATLIDKGFCVAHPILALNTLRTEMERSEQNGFSFLLKGCNSALRNPRAHEPRLLWSDSNENVLNGFALLSLLHKKLKKCVKTGLLSH